MKLIYQVSWELCLDQIYILLYNSKTSMKVHNFSCGDNVLALGCAIDHFFLDMLYYQNIFLHSSFWNLDYEKWLNLLWSPLLWFLTVYRPSPSTELYLMQLLKH